MPKVYHLAHCAGWAHARLVWESGMQGGNAVVSHSVALVPLPKSMIVSSACALGKNQV